jgi:uncharacterized OsmC-like protein
MSTVTFNAVSRKLPGGLAVENTVRDFKFIMDEPTSLGGTDTGMNPVEAVLTALGSCQMIVAAAFAKAQGIDLQEETGFENVKATGEPHQASKSILNKFS